MAISLHAQVGLFIERTGFHVQTDCSSISPHLQFHRDSKTLATILVLPQIPSSIAVRRFEHLSSESSYTFIFFPFSVISPCHIKKVSCIFCEIHLTGYILLTPSKQNLFKIPSNNTWHHIHSTNEGCIDEQAWQGHSQSKYSLSVLSEGLCDLFF